MKKLTRTQIIFIGFLLVVIASIFSLQLWRNQRVDTLQNVARGIRMFNVGYASHIELSTTTEFDWDLLYIFPPYTSEETITSTLGYDWWEVRFSTISESDSVTLLVFVHENRVVRWVDFPRKTGDFTLVLDNQPFTRENAIFYINPEETNQIRVLNIPD